MHRSYGILRNNTFWLAVSCYISFLHPDCCPLPVFPVSTDWRSQMVFDRSARFTLACVHVQHFIWCLSSCASEYHFVWLTVVVSRSERSWPRVNGPILACRLHGERSLTPSAGTWRSVCERVRRHGFRAPALQLTAVNISFSNECGHPQIFKGRNWAACFLFSCLAPFSKPAADSLVTFDKHKVSGAFSLHLRVLVVLDRGEGVCETSSRRAMGSAPLHININKYPAKSFENNKLIKLLPPDGTSWIDPQRSKTLLCLFMSLFMARLVMSMSDRSGIQGFYFSVRLFLSAFVFEFLHTKFKCSCTCIYTICWSGNIFNVCFWPFWRFINSDSLRDKRTVENGIGILCKPDLNSKNLYEPPHTACTLISRSHLVRRCQVNVYRCL